MRSPVFFRAVVPALAFGVFAGGASAQSLLVANQGDSTMSIVDAATAKQVAVIAEHTPGIHAHEVTASPDGRTAYLPIYGSVGVGKPGLSGSKMLVIDLPTRTVKGTVDFGHEVRPHLPVLDPVSGLLYVTTELDNDVTIVDPRTLKIVGTVPTGQKESHMLAISHDGKRGYTANVGPGTVSVLDLKRRRTIAVIPVVTTAGKTNGWGVQRVSVSNDDHWVFTSDEAQPRLAVIDATTNKVKGWVALPGLGYGTASTRDGRYLLVAVPAEHKVAVVDIAGMKVVRTLDVPPAPQEVLVRPDGKAAYVSCNTSGKVAQISLAGAPAQWSVKTLIVAGSGADGMGWAN